MALGTVIKPISDKDDYDVDLVLIRRIKVDVVIAGTPKEHGVDAIFHKLIEDAFAEVVVDEADNGIKAFGEYGCMLRKLVFIEGKLILFEIWGE